MQEEFGWKLVHGDVFRPPRQIMLLSVLVGSGLQLLLLTVLALCKWLVALWVGTHILDPFGNRFSSSE